MTASVQTKPTLTPDAQAVRALAGQLKLTDAQVASAQKWVDGLNTGDGVVQLGVHLLARKMGKVLVKRQKKTSGPKKATKSAPAAAPKAAPVAAVVTAEVTPAPPKKRGLLGKR